MYTLMLLVTLRVCDFGRGKLGWAKCGKSLKSKKIVPYTEILYDFLWFQINSGKKKNLCM